LIYSELGFGFKKLIGSTHKHFSSNKLDIN